MDFPNFHAAGWWLKKSHPAGRWQTNTFFFASQQNMGDSYWEKLNYDGARDLRNARTRHESPLRDRKADQMERWYMIDDR